MSDHSIERFLEVDLTECAECSAAAAQVMAALFFWWTDDTTMALAGIYMPACLAHAGAVVQTGAAHARDHIPDGEGHTLGWISLAPNEDVIRDWVVREARRVESAIALHNEVHDRRN